MSEDKWGFNPVKKVSLTESQYDNLLDRVEDTGKRRKQIHTPSGFSEVDFLAGAMATMEALGIGCPPWVWDILAGNKIL